MLYARLTSFVRFISSAAVVLLLLAEWSQAAMAGA